MTIPTNILIQFVSCNVIFIACLIGSILYARQLSRHRRAREGKFGIAGLAESLTIVTGGMCVWYVAAMLVCIYT